jgi:adenosine deaminase
VIDAGALVTINTDTPAIFDISLSSELALLETRFGLQREGVERIVRNAFEVSFDAPRDT